MKQQIYVYLLDEGTDAWRPVEADHIRENLYLITSENQALEDEQWQFGKGDMVRCETKTFSDGRVALVANSKEV